MVRRNYDIETEFRKTEGAHDSSYKSCLCALLVFLSICIIILLAALPWKKFGSKDIEVGPRNSEKMHYKEHDPFFEKIIEMTTKKIGTTSEPSSIATVFSTSTSGYHDTEKPELSLSTHLTTEKIGSTKKMFWTIDEIFDGVTTDGTIDGTSITPLPKPKNITSTTERITETLETFPDIESRFGSDKTSTDSTREDSSPDYGSILTFSSTTSDTKFDEISKTTNLEFHTSYYGVHHSTETSTPEIFDKEILVDRTEETTGDVSDFITFVPTTEDSTRPIRELETSTVESETSTFDKEILFDPIEKTTDYFVDSIIFTPTTEDSTRLTTESETFTDDSATILFDSTSSSTTKTREFSRISSTSSISSTTPLTWLSTDTANKTCVSESCKNKAASILGHMKPTISPCDNFYDFACGSNSVSRKTQRKQQVTDRIIKHIRKSSASDSERKYQQFYESCVTFDPLKVNYTNLFLHSTFAIDEFYDGFYTIPNKEDHLAELLARLLKYNSAPFFDIDLDVDPDTKKFVFKMLPSKSLMISEIELSKTDVKAKCEIDARFALKEKPKNLNSVYNNYLECLRNKTKYINDVRRALKAFDIFTHLDDYNKTQHIQAILFNLELTLFPVFKSFPTQKDVHYVIENSQFSSLSIEEMQKKFSIINWQVFFEKLVGKNVSSSHLVHIYYSNVFEDLFDELSALKPRDVHNIALAMYVHDLYKEFGVPFHSFPRDAYCLEIMMKFLPNITSELYLKSWSKEQLHRIETESLNIFSQLQTVFRTSISTQKMLTMEDQEALLSKLNGISLAFYYSGTKIGGSKALNGVAIEKKNFFKNFIEILQRYRLNKYRMWNKSSTVSENLWAHFLTPFSTEPVSIYSHNVIAVPYAMFLLEDLEAQPRYVTMSTIGFKLAQELSFIIGRKFDLAPISESVRELFDTEIKACLKDEVEKHIEIKGIEIPYFENVTLSLNRHIIDGAAIKLAFDTFRDEAKTPENLPWIEESFSHQQLFYISTVQEICDESQNDLFMFMKQLLDGIDLPERVRVENFLANDEMFSTIFECIPGSNLNPPIKCKQFPNISPASIVYDEGYGMTSS